MVSDRRFAFVSHFDYTAWRFKIPLIRRLQEEGFSVAVICPKGDYSDRFESIGVQHIHWNLIRENRNLAVELRSLFHLRTIFRRVDPAMIHTLTARPNLYGSLARMAARIEAPIVNSVMGLGTLYTGGERSVSRVKMAAFNAAYRLAFLRSSRVVLLNRDDYRFFLDRRIVRRGQAALIRGEGVNLVDFDCGTETVKNEGKQKLFNNTKVTILIVARLLREKGIQEFVRAAETIQERLPDIAQFAIVGGADTGNPSNLPEEEIRSIQERGIALLVGFQDDPRPYYQASDIYCLPSYREGVPTTVLEAMACGLPIVTTDVPGCRETVEEGRNGFFVPARNSEILADRLERLIRDAALRVKMGEQSRILVEEQFSIERIVEEHIALYRQICPMFFERNRP